MAHSVHPDHYFALVGFQLSQSDGYAVCKYSKEKRLQEASRDDLRDFNRALYEQQEKAEKQVGETFVDNGKGFAKFQAPSLTEFAKYGKGELETLRDQIGYHWAQVMLLKGYVAADCWEAYDEGLLKGRPYAGKGTRVAEWPAKG